MTAGAVARRSGRMATGVRGGLRRDGDQTRERLLDAAEALFAAQGFHGTSMRDVAGAMDCGIALVKYHCGTKELLFDAVVERRAADMAAYRTQALDAALAQAGGRPLAVEALVSGYVWPFIERSRAGDAGWRNYSLFVARHANAPEFSKVLGKHYDPVARRYLAEFARSLPALPSSDLFYAFSFMVGTMVSTVAQPGRLEQLSKRRIRAADVEVAFQRMLPFLSAGFKSLVPRRP